MLSYFNCGLFRIPVTGCKQVLLDLYATGLNVILVVFLEIHQGRNFHCGKEWWSELTWTSVSIICYVKIYGINSKWRLTTLKSIYRLKMLIYRLKFTIYRRKFQIFRVLPNGTLLILLGFDVIQFGHSPPVRKFPITFRNYNHCPTVHQLNSEK